MAHTTARENYIIFWQDTHDADTHDSEYCIVVQGYSDVISLAQGDSEISVNYESLEEFIKRLRTVKKNNDRLRKSK